MVAAKTKNARGSAVKKAVADAATLEPTPVAKRVSKRAAAADADDADDTINAVAPVSAKESGSKRKQKVVEAADEPQQETRKKVKIVLKAALDPHAAKVVTIIDSKMPTVSSMEPEGVSIEDIPDIADLVTDAPSAQLAGLPKSGRDWKPVQKQRFSSQFRAGSVFNLSKTQQSHAAERARKAQVKELEREMNKERKDKETLALEKRKEQSARKAKNQYNSQQVQSINPEKLKKMSKKQLRMVSKTVMGKNGQIELVPAYK